MKSEFALAFNQICAEYSLPREVVLDAVRAALVTAYRRDWKIATTQNVTAEINFDTGLARIYVEKLIVEEPEDTQTEITLKQARRKNPDAQLGNLVMMDVTPKNFGRIAAQTAKQVITQRLREAERESQFNRFSRQEGEIIIGTIQSIKSHGFTLHLERREEAHMPKREQIPGERYTLHQKIRVYVLEVKRTPRGPEIVVSRSHPHMLRRLLELEVPEIRNAQVEVIAIAREAGSRSKVAVTARQPGLDPVGACVGMRGIRIQTISRELHGERIDVVKWDEDPAQFIANALSMQQVVSVILDEHNAGGRTASVVVMDDQLSLAIGRAGQNARLAAKLTGWRVDIQGATEAALWALEQVNAAPDLLTSIKDVASMIPKLASVMRSHERDRYPYTDEERRVIKMVVESVRSAMIERRNAERPGAKQARARRTAQQKAEAKRLEEEEQARASVPKQAYEMALDELEISTKVLGHLERNGLKNVGHVLERVAMGDEALLMLQGIGAKSLREVKNAVDRVNAQFASEVVQEAEAVTEVEVSETAEVSADAEVVAEEVVTEQPAATALESVEAAPAEVAAEPEDVVQEAVSTEESLADAEVSAAVSEEAAPDSEEAIEAVAEAVEEEEMEESQPEPEPESEDDIELQFDMEMVQAVDDFELEEEFDEEDIFEGKPQAGKRKKRKKRRKRRALVYDEETGETFVVRKHRQSDAWDEYGDY